MISVSVQGKPFNITVIQVYAPTSNAEEAKVKWFYEDFQDLLELTPKKDVLFIIGDWNAKVGSQEIPGITGKFGLRVQNEAGQRLMGKAGQRTSTFSWSRERTGHSKYPLLTTHNTRDDSTHGHHQKVNTKFRLIIFFAAKDGESQQKKDRELTVAQIMSSFLPNSDLK